MYLHGGFALGRGDLDDCDGARKAGFAVFLPSLRGENGNPGDFEYGFGELDDALAAIRFAAALPGIDPKRVVVFGHSMGGMLSALTSLFQDLPAVATGSAGGLFDERLFGATPIPFADSPMERRLRLFAPFAEQAAFCLCGQRRSDASRGERSSRTQNSGEELAVRASDRRRKSPDERVHVHGCLHRARRAELALTLAEGMSAGR
ncbi:MAG: alpha/beta hydrolase family protein [Polyangiales bacterium]